MKLKYIITTALSLLISYTATLAQTPKAQIPKIKKAILIIVDGIPADMIEKVHTPNIDGISKVGGYTRAYMGGERGGYSETPTISAVCYTSMITGTWANKHNVWGNGIENPNYNYWTIFRFLEESKPESKLGIYSTWLDNRTKILGAGKPETNQLKMDVNFDGYELDTVRFPHDKVSTHINLIDEEVTKQAAQSIKKDAPDLSWVYLQYTDDAGHRYGDGKEMITAIEKADRQVGDIYNAVKYREQYFNEDWLFVVVTDHGRDVATGLSHGKQSERERTIWISSNSKKLNQHFHAHQPAMVDVLPSVARHLAINITQAQKYELDGVPFIGEVSIADPKATKVKNNIIVEWTPFTTKGKIKILLTATNNFKGKGVAGKDDYVLLGEFDVSKRKAEVSVPKVLMGKEMYKIVIEGEHNTLNRWVK
ncbi:alkaline phosphatase family protein [Pedobacter immunditicola]|uniref:alkaline phosphatase family protein n=1 Tax=Pedobacter immunditicola TaxID=3133440 RepID=UPI0030AF249C